METSTVQVAVPPLASELTYSVPAEIAHQIKVGVEVRVPLGSRIATGYVIGRECRSLEEPPKDLRNYKLRPIKGAQRSYPSFLESQLDFFRWVSEYYGDSLANVIEVAVPKPVPTKTRHLITALDAAKRTKLRGPTEKAVFDFIASHSLPVDRALVLNQFKGAASILKRFIANGVVSIRQDEIFDQFNQTEPVPEWVKLSLELSAGQQACVDRLTEYIDKRKFCAELLHGVTGSGKTEVYIEVALAALRRNLGALVIVPEIALTPQLVDRFRGRLGTQVAVLHSAMQPRARWEAWRSLIEGRSCIGIGARSAVFAPIEKLGVIIVDEEHEGSFKQGEGLRYNARDLAVVRAQKLNCPVILGSATPSLESYYNCVKKKYHYMPLVSRPDHMARIEVELVNLGATKPWDMASKNVSGRLREAITETLSRKEQVFVLYNRRGFACYLQCERCEQALECPHCSVTLTFHQNRNQLLCHYCSFSMVKPSSCPKCTKSLGNKEQPAALAQRGAGTEKIFDELIELFPDASIERLDRDAVNDAASYRRILSRVRSRDTDILVGTQMIAKGHDLPGVTLVGVADCDVGLHMPDFRASERVFQLLTQVAGRAGRGDQSGTVILQTRAPKHPSLQFTLRQDFKGFAERELHVRRQLAYPPFTRMLRIVGHSENKDKAALVMQHMRKVIVEILNDGDKDIEVLGPAPAPLQRLRGQWRIHLILKSHSPSKLVAVMRKLKESKLAKEIRVVFDLDPQEML